MKNHSSKLVGELCNYLGEDLENPMCQELLTHVKDCPDCRNYIESVKLTISICKESARTEPVPEDIKQNLLKNLKLVK